MNQDNKAYTFDIPLLHQAEDIVRRDSGKSLPDAFALYAREIVRQGRFPVAPKSFSVSDYAYRLDAVNKELDALMQTMSHQDTPATNIAQVAWNIQMCLMERRHCKQMLNAWTEQFLTSSEMFEHRKGA